MQKLIDDYISMNVAGRVLELCEKHYDKNVLMLSNGEVFAKSMQESYEKQKAFIDSVQKYDVVLLSSSMAGNISELTFRYTMTGADLKENTFTGRHIQTWKNGKIVKEEYSAI